MENVKKIVKPEPVWKTFMKTPEEKAQLKELKKEYKKTQRKKNGEE